MSQPVKLSDTLVLDARMIGRVTARSINGQVEYWARLGQALEPLLGGEQALQLCQRAAARPLSECLATVDTPEGRMRTTAFLHTQPYPHYEAHPTRKGLLVRTEQNGRQTTGRFVRRQFQTVR